MRFGIIMSVFALLLFSGCVSSGKYNTKVKEAEELTAQKSSLEAQVQDLTTELDGLKKRVEEKAEKAAELEKASKTYEDLVGKLEKEIAAGQVMITEMKNRLTMTMVDKILFPSGSANISTAGEKVIDKVIPVLKGIKDKRIQVEGHTDNIKISGKLKKKFPTNWELSTARASEVVRYLQEYGGIDPRVLSATGYAEYQPVASNDDAKGRRQNRRIEIVLLPL